MIMSYIYSQSYRMKVYKPIEYTKYFHNSRSGHAQAYDLATVVDPCQPGPTKGNYEGPNCNDWEHGGGSY